MLGVVDEPSTKGLLQRYNIYPSFVKDAPHYWILICRLFPGLWNKAFEDLYKTKSSFLQPFHTIHIHQAAKFSNAQNACYMQ